MTLHDTARPRTAARQARPPLLTKDPNAVPQVVTPSNLISVLLDATAAQAGDRGVVAMFHAAFLGRPTSDDLGPVAERLLAPGYVAHGSAPMERMDRLSLVASWRRLGTAIPDFTVEVAEILRDGDRWIVRSTLSGRPAARFLGLSPSGRGFRIQAIHIHRLTGGRIAESWHVEDWSAAARQLASE